MADRLKQTWEKYRELVVPDGAGPEQVEGTWLAFYAGAASFFHIVMSRLSPEAEPTAADMAFMDELARELREHEQAVVARSEGH